MVVKYKAFAKINLTLDLTGVLPNGYHGIFTCMQSVGIYDTVTVKNSGEGIRLSCSEKYIPCDERNTAFKAAKIFYEKTGLKPACEIYINKVIPSGAGMGGGSADAAAVLKGLNYIHNANLHTSELLEMALNIGADVPFCLLGGTKLCQNIGEVMSTLPNFDAKVLVVKPYERVSTKDAYARFDSAENISHPDNNSFLYYSSKGEYDKALSYCENIFEKLCDVSFGDEIKKAMYQCNAVFSSMTGSGSAYFGIFNSKEDMKNCEIMLRDKVEKIFITSTVQRGIEY